MKGRDIASPKTGVGVRKEHHTSKPQDKEALDKSRKPLFNYREDAYHAGPVLGMIAFMAISILGSIASGKMFTIFAGIAAGFLPRTLEVKIEEGLQVFEPLTTLLFLWMFFDVRHHVKNGAGSYGTLSIFGIQVVKVQISGHWLAVIFKGEISCFKWIKVFRHDVGYKSLTIRIKGSFTALDENGIPQQVCSKNGGDPEVEVFFASLDPFKGVTRVDQGEVDEDVIWKNTISSCESLFRNAARYAAKEYSLTMNDVMGSENLNQTFMSALLGIIDDDPNGGGKRRLNSYYLLIDGKKEWCYETEDGIILYNVRVTDMGPHPDTLTANKDRGISLVRARSEGEQKLIEARARQEAIELILPVLSGDMEKALLVLEILNGDEYKVVEHRLTLMGLTGEQQVEVARAIGTAAPAVAAFLGGRSQSPKGKGEKKGDKPQTPKPEGGDRKPDRGSEAPKPKQEGKKESPFGKRRWRR